MNERNFYFSVLWTHLTIITFSKMLIDRYIVSQLFYVCSQTGSCIIICVLISTTISCVCIILSVLCKEASTKTFLIILKLRIVMFGVLQNTCQLCHHDSLVKWNPYILSKALPFLAMRLIGSLASCYWLCKNMASVIYRIAIRRSLLTAYFE